MKRIELDELPVLLGRAWVLGDGVSAEQILPAEHHGSELAARRHPTSSLLTDLAVQITPGDFLVAGRDFARGGAGAEIVRALKSAGIGAVLARSFAPPFARLAIEQALPPLLVEETPAIKQGDRLRVSIEAHIVANLSSGDRYVIRNLEGEDLDILRAGGVTRHRALQRS